MKIALYYNLNFGGAKRVVYEHVRGLVNKGHTVDVYTLDKKRDIFDLDKYAQHVFRYDFSLPDGTIPVISRLQKDYTILQELPKLHKKIAEHIDAKNYDIVICETDLYSQAPNILKYLKTDNLYFSLEPLRMAYEYGLRIPDSFSPPHKLYEMYTRYLRKMSDRQSVLSAKHVSAISYFGRECMIQNYDIYPHVSYLGVDEKVFKRRVTKRKNQVFFVADKSSISGYDLAEQAVTLIPERIRPELKVVEWTLDNNKRLSDIELARQYSESLITLSLNRFDTFGLVPLESMACQTPAITFNVAGYRETVRHNKTGYLVEFTPQAIAEAMMKLLEDRDLLEKMGENGRKIIEEKWTSDYQIAVFEALLYSLIDKDKPKSR